MKFVKILLIGLSCLIGWRASMAQRFDAARVHDPSTIVYENSKFYVFHTGKGVLFRSSSDITNWQSPRSVFEQPLKWWNDVVTNFNGFLWAPDIANFNNYWHLYYSVSSWGKNRSAIGLAVNKTLDSSNKDYKWEDKGLVIESHQSDKFNTIDPAVLVDDDKVWLVFGSYWSGIKLIELNPKTGKRMDAKIYSLASAPEIEAPFIYKRDGYYYLFVNFGLCCRGINSTYNIRVGRSKDVRGPYLDADGKDMQNGGGTLFLETYKNRIGPGHSGIFKHNGIEYFSYHYYDANNNGRPRLMIQQIQWNNNGFPVILQEK